MSEHRHELKAGLKTSDLPVDFLKMVDEVFSTHFKDTLKALDKIQPGSHFVAGGKIYPTEVVLSVTLTHEDQLAATTVYASCDFDPKASSPTIQDTLNLCVDACAGVFAPLLDPQGKDAEERLEAVAMGSLSALDDVPFEWTETEVEKKRVWVKIDKANPKLDQMADEWLAKNDPKAKQREQEEEEEAKGLFVTGEKSKRGGSGGGETVH